MSEILLLVPLAVMAFYLGRLQTRMLWLETEVYTRQQETAEEIRAREIRQYYKRLADNVRYEQQARSHD